MDSNEDENNRYIKNLEKHIESSKEASKYSSDRFDILLISLSTSSLIFSIGFYKNVIPEGSNVDNTFIKISWLLLVISLISNLLSQVTGYYAHYYDVKATNNLIRKERGKEFKGNQDLFEKCCKYLDKITIYLNLMSLIGLIVGIILIVLFFSDNI